MRATPQRWERFILQLPLQTGHLQCSDLPSDPRTWMCVSLTLTAPTQTWSSCLPKEFTSIGISKKTNLWCERVNFQRRNWSNRSVSTHRAKIFTTAFRNRSETTRPSPVQKRKLRTNIQGHRVR